MEAELETRSRRLHKLMQHRVREVLLVSSLYDAYILQEDGHLTEQLHIEYEELRLSHAPRFTHARTPEEALSMLDERRFDLVLVVTRLLDLDLEAFAAEVKAGPFPLPVVVLAFDNRDLDKLTRLRAEGQVDGVFTWQGDAVVLLALIKYIEDKENIDGDISASDLRVILVVEDSVRAASSFLSVLYPELMKQSRALFSEGGNRLQKLLRMRTRPKVIHAWTFEQACDLYKRYQPNLMAVISDVDFPRGGELTKEAGLALVSEIRTELPDLPILLQSAEEKYRRAERELRVLFVTKSSPRLLHRIRRFLAEDLGFGPFIFRLPNRTEVCRAEDLGELEQCIESIPAQSLEYHARHHHFSKWLMARSEFELATVIRPQTVEEFETAEALRQQTLAEIREVRGGLRAGVITDFSRKHFDPGSIFQRLGRGSLGGKARGLAFINQLLSAEGSQERFGPVQVRVPQSFSLATDAFDDFLEFNELHDVMVGALPDAEIARLFGRARLPGDALLDLRTMLAEVRYPLAVRSSSLLEDSLVHPFAGVYATALLPNNAIDLQQRLAELAQAIRFVYSTTFFRRARDYVKLTGHGAEEEKMGVVIQRLVGRPFGRRYYPHAAGLAFARAGAPPPKGLGPEACGELVLGFSHLLEQGGRGHGLWAGPEAGAPASADAQAVEAAAQDEFFALNLGSAPHFVAGRPSLNLTRSPLAAAVTDGLVDGQAAAGNWTPSPAALLGPWAEPMSDALGAVLELAARGMGSDVELEFACDLGPDWRVGAPASAAQSPTLHVLQARPASFDSPPVAKG